MLLVLATGNRHKVEEIREILKDLPVAVKPVSEFPGVPDVVEDGATLRDNAVKKARSVALCLKQWTLADDTGLEVDALNGAPGVYSARWSGEGCSYDDNNRKLLDSLRGLPCEKRTARFRCVIALSDPEGNTRAVDGQIDGIIGGECRGGLGFGYDPLFVVPEQGMTFAELPMDVKNGISHRGRALRKARELLKEILCSNAQISNAPRRAEHIDGK